MSIQTAYKYVVVSVKVSTLLPISIGLILKSVSKARNKWNSIYTIWKSVIIHSEDTIKMPTVERIEWLSGK